MHETYMRRCFELARKGVGLVSPNPLVGAVLVKNQKIIGEGFHARHGSPHAEVMAFQNASEDVTGATLYVNLEPCCHTKKITPPCAPLVIEKKIKHLVICNLDPNPAVQGEGIKQIQAAGIQVTTGVLAAEGEELNEIFFHRMRTKKPFITLKTAATLDGKTALPSGESKWITGEKARQDAHLGRQKYDAILIGAETLRQDNPALTVRIPGVVIERMPYRLILTQSGKLPKNAQVFQDEFRHRTFVITDSHTTIDSLPPQQIIRLSRLNDFPFDELYEKLAALNIHSLWLEGGASLHSLFLQQRQVQRMELYFAPKIMGEGKTMFQHTTHSLENLPKMEQLSVQLLGEDLKITGRI